MRRSNRRPRSCKPGCAAFAPDTHLKAKRVELSDAYLVLPQGATEGRPAGGRRGHGPGSARASAGHHLELYNVACDLSQSPTVFRQG